MQQFGVEESSEVSAVAGPGGGDPATAAASREEPLPERVEPSGEREEPLPERVEPSSEPGKPASDREELLAEVRRREAELERYRAHAERTSKLFLSATNYAEWVRENARRDAELALRKARVKVEKLDAIARELEQTELELARRQDELTRLQALTDETRARLSSFLAAGLQALDTEAAAGHADGPKPALGDLQDTLQGQLPSTSVPLAGGLAEVERPER